MGKRHTGTVVWEEPGKGMCKASKAFKQNEFRQANALDTNELLKGKRVDVRQRTNVRGLVASKERNRGKPEITLGDDEQTLEPVNDRRWILIVFLDLEKGGRDVSPSPKRVNVFLLNFFRFRKVFLKFLRRRQNVRVVGFRIALRLANAVNDIWLYGLSTGGRSSR